MSIVTDSEAIYSLYLALEEVNPNGLLVVLGKDALTVALDHTALTDGAIADDNDLDGRLHLLLPHAGH